MSNRLSVLVTGGAGFIGCRLARRLVAAGHAVQAFDSLHPQVHVGRGWPTALPPDVTRLSGDVTSATCWDAVLKLCAPDVVVHLAAETGTGQSLTEATRHGSVNVVGTTQMLDALTRAEMIPAHLVLTSSRAVYGEGHWVGDDGVVFAPGPRRGTDLARGCWDARAPSGGVARSLPSRAGSVAPMPTSVYGATKVAQEHIMSAWAGALSTRLSVLRLQNVYGPGQSIANAYTGIVTRFAHLATREQSPEVFEDGNIVRDLVYIDDVVDALVRTIDRPPTDSRTVDIGSGDPIVLLDLATRITALVGGPPPVVSGRFRPGDVRAASCDISDATEQLGYRPATDLDEGLRRLVEWVRVTTAPDRQPRS